MARLYANENFPLPVVEHLRALGHDVLTVKDVGRSDSAETDEAVLAYSRSDNRALLTLNRRHFIRLHQQAPGHAGIVACTYDPEFERQAHRIHVALDAAGALNGCLLRVNRP